MKRSIALMAMLILVSASAFADIAQPEPVKTPKAKAGTTLATSMDITLDRDAKEARLIIPKSQIKQLRAELDELDDSDDNTAAATAPSGSGRIQTVMTGIFFSLALVFGGIWFVRSGRSATRTAKGLVIGAVAAGMLWAATFVYANIAPPTGTRVINGRMFSEAMRRYGTGYGQIKLETSATARRVQLIVPDPVENPISE